MTELEYWEECLAIAADENSIQLTIEQITALAESVKGGHENYGMAFYSPPASDRISQVEHEWESKYKALERKFSSYQEDAESAVKQALGFSNSSVSIGKHGEVTRHDGRTERIQ